MKNEDLIISMIQQDLKHNQLIAGLKRVGLEGDEIYYLEILRVGSDLMEVPKENEIEDSWTEIYIRFMNEATHFKISNKSDSLKLLAEMCYRQLKTSIKRSK